MSFAVSKSDQRETLDFASSKTERELFCDALTADSDDECRWAAVRELRRRNSLKVFNLATEFCRSTKPLERALGLDVLAQLGAGRPMSERLYFEDCISTGIRHLTDNDPRVVQSAAWALAHLADERAISALIELRRHSDSGVRHAVAVGIAGSGNPAAIQTLIDLMNDRDDEVRNWATFGLGTQSAEDRPEIRQALRIRLSDTFKEVRDEAIWGLTKRKDTLGIRMLLERLEADRWIQGDEDAACDILGLPHNDTSVTELCDRLRAILNG